MINSRRRALMRGYSQTYPPPPTQPSPPGGGQDFVPDPPPGITYTTLAEHTFQTAEEDGFYVDIGTIIIPAPGLGVALYRVGDPGGSGPFKLEHAAPAGTPKWIRGTVQFYITENWKCHTSLVNKVAFQSRKDTPNDQPSMILNLRGTGSGPIFASINMQDSGEVFPKSPGDDGARDLTQDALEFTRNQVTTLIYQLYIGTSGNPDGKAHLWQDGTQILNVNDCTWLPPASSEYWTLPSLYPIWGGTGGTIAEIQGMVFRRFKIEVGA